MGLLQLKIIISDIEIIRLITGSFWSLECVSRLSNCKFSIRVDCWCAFWWRSLDDRKGTCLPC